MPLLRPKLNTEAHEHEASEMGGGGLYAKNWSYGICI